MDVRRKLVRRAAVVAVIVVALGACGGGGSADPTPTSAPADSSADEGSAAGELATRPAAELSFRPAVLAFPNDPIGAALVRAQLDGGSDESTVSALPEVDPEEVITPPEAARPETTVVFPDANGDLLFILGPEEVTGDSVASAIARPNDLAPGSWLIQLEFTVEGSDAIDAMADRHLGGQIALVVDGIVYSAPTVQQATFGGTAVIGGLSEAEAAALVSRLVGSD